MSATNTHPRWPLAAPREPRATSTPDGYISARPDPPICRTQVGAAVTEAAVVCASAPGATPPSDATATATAHSHTGSRRSHCWFAGSHAAWRPGDSRTMALFAASMVCLPRSSRDISRRGGPTGASAPSGPEGTQAPRRTVS